MLAWVVWMFGGWAMTLDATKYTRRTQRSLDDTSHLCDYSSISVHLGTLHVRKPRHTIT